MWLNNLNLCLSIFREQVARSDVLDSSSKGDYGRVDRPRSRRGGECGVRRGRWQAYGPVASIPLVRLGLCRRWKWSNQIKRDMNTSLYRLTQLPVTTVLLTLLCLASFQLCVSSKDFIFFYLLFLVKNFTTGFPSWWFWFSLHLTHGGDVTAPHLTEKCLQKLHCFSQSFFFLENRKLLCFCVLCIFLFLCLDVKSLT